MTDNRIVFLLVNYYNETEVVRFLNYQRINKTDTDIKIIVVDNGGNNPTALESLTVGNPNVTILKSKVNAGYFGAAYIGLTHYLEHNPYPAATIICNTDINFITPDFVRRLKEKVAQGNFDIMGPDVYSTMLKYHQNPYLINRIDPKRVKLYRTVTSNAFVYGLFTILHLLKTKFVKSNTGNRINERMETYCIHGSFMVFSKSYFEKGGTIHYPSLLFGEELFVAETARKLGMKTIYEPDLVINHNQHSTTGIFKSANIVRFMHQSYDYLYNAFFTAEAK